jgi:hypothetical protein
MPIGFVLEIDVPDQLVSIRKRLRLTYESQGKMRVSADLAGRKLHSKSSVHLWCREFESHPFRGNIMHL